MKQNRKYTLFGGLLVSTLLLTTSCAGLSDLDMSQVENTGTQTVTITVLPETQTGGMRAGITNGENSTISKGTKINQLIYALYEVSGSTYKKVEAYSKSVSYPLPDNEDNSLTITIEKGKTYKMAFWAQNSGCNAYTTTDLENVTVSYNSGAKNNDESRDAFCCSIDIDGKESSYEAILKRPFAQINVGTTGADYKNIMKNPNINPNMKVTQSKITLSGVATSINVVTNEVSSTNLTNVTFDFATIPAFMNMPSLPTDDALYNGEDNKEEFLEVDLDKDKDIKEYKTNYPTLDKDGNYLTETFKYLSMCYVLVPSTTEIPKEMDDHDYSSVLSEVKVSFAETDANGAPVNGYTPIYLKNIPVKRNWRTNILGGLRWMKDPTDPENPDPEDPDPDPEPDPDPDDPTSVFGVATLKITLDSDYENGYIDWDGDWKEADDTPDPDDEEQ